jgi:hypothetical protein
MNHRTLLRKLGTNAAIGEAVKRDPTTISHWRMRGIPPHAWVQIARFAQRCGIAVTVEQLADRSPAYGKRGYRRIIRSDQPTQAA